MKNNRSKNFNKYDIADRIYKIILILLVFIFVALFIWLLQMSKKDLINLQYSEVQSLNKDVSYILENRRRKIDEDAIVLEKYISQGKTNEEVLTYLQTEHSVMSTLDPEYSDIYGYIRGEYLDGSGWAADETFIPKQRPWYLKAKERNGSIAFASPYIDAITGNLIISYSKLLSDGESVISYDVQLSNMQKLVDDTVNEKCLETIIFDESEIILADSQKQNISFAFSELKNEYYVTLYQKYKSSNGNDFEFRYGRNNYYVFNNPITDGMKQLVIVDAQLMFSSLKKAIVVGILLFSAITVLVTVIILGINRRMKKAEDDVLKIRKLYFEANTDKLTGLYNRRAYEDKIAKIMEEGIPSKLIYLSFDLNGLKHTNDTHGHFAGDALISGAASVIKKVWGRYGRTYRIGGDEFSAILEINLGELKALKEEFDKEILNWSKENQTELSISYGYAEKEKHKNASLRELIELADEKMYTEKTSYYKKSGIDRRKR